MIYAHILGGLGNQMFAYAFCRLLKNKYPSEPIVMRKDKGLFENDRYDLEDFTLDESLSFTDSFDTIKINMPLRYVIYKVATKFNHFVFFKFGYKEARRAMDFIQPALNACGIFVSYASYCRMHYPKYLKNMLCEGIFITPLYVESCRAELLADFTPKAKPDEINEKYLSEIGGCSSVCLHVRRGDYFDGKHKEFEVCTVNYYNKALLKMNELVKDAHYFVFSDGMQWVKQNISFPEGSEVTYVEAGNEKRAVNELRLMYSCKHFIISNSTFSWWAQYLGSYEGKRVIAPNIYKRDTDEYELKMDSWTLIDVDKEN